MGIEPTPATLHISNVAQTMDMFNITVT